MGYQLNADALNTVFAKWSDTYDIYAPKLFAGTGRSSMQDIVRYGKITKTEEIVWDKRSDYSAKDVLLPVCQTLFYFNENTVTEAEAPEKRRHHLAAQLRFARHQAFRLHVSPEWS